MVFTTFTHPFLTGVILENVKMSAERYCFSELEKDISLEILALHKNILEREKMIFEVKKKKKLWAQLYHVEIRPPFLQISI